MLVFSLDKHNKLSYYRIMEQAISLIPYPYQLEARNGTFNSHGAEIAVSADAFFAAECKLTGEQLTAAGLKSRISSQSKMNSVILSIIQKESVGTYSLSDPESYILEIQADTITVTASAAAGAFYAIQTLRQLALTYKNDIPCLFIYDKPAVAWRGALLDTCRSFYSVAFVKKFIDLCAFHKMNRFHWHLTDDQGWRLPVPEYPLLTRIGSERWGHCMPLLKINLDSNDMPIRQYYSDEEISSVVEYARQRHITIVPEVELPGHVSALLASYPEFGCTGGPYAVENRTGIFSDVLCAGNDDIFSLYNAVFNTLCRLFPGKWIHIGGDECPTERWQNCPKCQARMKKEGFTSPSQLQSWITEEMSSLIIAHNKIPIGWDEVLNTTEKYPLPESVVVQSWHGLEGGEKAATLKHAVIMSPHNFCYMNYKNYDLFEEPGALSVTTVKKAYSFSPIPKDMSAQTQKYILGAECSLWTEDLPSSKVAEYLLFPRFCALAECMWLPADRKDFNRFATVLPAHKNRLSSLDCLYYNGALE